MKSNSAIENGNGIIAKNGNEKPSGKTDGQLSPEEVIRSEVNFLRLPFFALWDKDVRKRSETEYKAVIRRGSEKLEIEWIVMSNTRFGYPGPFDKMVHKTIEHMTNELPFPVQNPIPLGSLYSFYKRMGIDSIGGAQYRKIKEALQRITLTGIISKGAFYSRKDNKFIEDTFHLYDRVIFKGTEMPNGNIADDNYVYLSSWYLDSINANYVKPVDWNYYKSLETPIAQRLYELLSVKFYGSLMKGSGIVSYKYSTLCELLPMTRQRYFSLMRKILDPAHVKLKETGFLEDWSWEDSPKGEGGKDWLIKYYPGRRVGEEIGRFRIGEQLEFELPLLGEKRLVEVELTADESPMLKQLVERGITNSTARKLAKEHPIEQIQNQIEVFDWLKETGSPLVEKNPAGFLRKSIEENYQPPKEYHDNLKREAVEQKNRDRRKRWIQHREEQISQDIANWDKIPPEERVQGMLEFWIAGQKLNMIHPTPE